MIEPMKSKECWVDVSAPDDVISPEDQEAYALAIESAVEIHTERERVRNGLWKQYPAVDQMRNVKVKAERCMQIFEKAEREQRDLTPEEVAYVNGESDDIINYTVFTVRKLKGE